MLIQNAKAFINGKFQEKTDLLIRDGRISAIGTGLAAEAGATHVTHTFNAQTPLNHRAPGVPGDSGASGR